MKKTIFTILLLLFFNLQSLLAKDLTIIKGKIIENQNNYIKILDIKLNKEIVIIGKFLDIKKGDFVKIFIDKNGKISKIKKTNLKRLRERIRKIGKFKCRCRCKKGFNQNFHNNPNK